MLEQLKELKSEITDALDKAENLEQVEDIRIRYLSRKGIIPAWFSRMREVEPADRKEFGQLLNSLRDESYELINNKKKSFVKKKHANIDLTLPGRKPIAGKLHPLLKVVDEVKSILKHMGFSVASGPEVETEYYIFDALNMPEWHPARKITDSLYVDEHRLLRTETSSVQIRTMEKGKPPFRIIAPGRVYRNEKENATHGAMFMQCEGLYVDKNVSFAELKGTLLAFFRELFGHETKIRFRPHYFPFTEPSAEVDISCYKCKGKGCSLCKQTGWIELGGCGMVHPVLLEGVGVDSEEYTGFAFGLGLDRIAMGRFGVHDLRDLYENDLRFLEQF